MPDETNHLRPEPYVIACSFCDQGKLRIWKACEKPVALCDECELYWEDIAAVFLDPQIAPTGSYPDGPCGADSPKDWSQASPEDIHSLGLSRFVISESA